jgi:hypothetical protein
MQPITPAQVRRILEITDSLGIHREAVVIPLAREGVGAIDRDGAKLVITAPEGEAFEGWLTGLAETLGQVDLVGVLRVDPDGE